MRKGKRKELERSADAFLASFQGPNAGERLREFGAQRIWARATSEKGAKLGLGARRAHRSPAIARHVLLTVLLVMVLMVSSVTGAYALSYGAQPDSSLYGVRIFFERARIALTVSGLEDARLEMEYSQRRMDELEGMVSRGSGEGADRWLAEYSRNIERAGAFLAAASTEEAESLALRFHEMLDDQARRMEGLRDGGPPQLAESLEEAYGVCGQERERMRSRCGVESCEGESATNGAGDGEGGKERGGSKKPKTP
ncbi:MAG: hypothetical protein HPY75_12890 [Actinobacteria bacterium]|nr:hypothetical protein [Actinomycetota bacterium]